MANRRKHSFCCRHRWAPTCPQAHDMTCDVQPVPAFIHGLALCTPLVWGVLLLRLWPRRKQPLGQAFLLFIAIAGAYSVLRTLSLTAPFAETLMESGFLRLPQAVVAPVMLNLVLRITGRSHQLTTPGFAGLIGATVWVLTMALSQPEPAAGWWELTHVGVQGGLLLVSLTLVTNHALSIAALYRRRAIIVALALWLPWASTLLIWVSGMGVVATALTAVLLEYALFRVSLLDITPIARDIVVDSMSNPTFALDLNGRVLDANPAAKALLSHRTDMFGHPLRATLPEWAPWSALGGHSDLTLARDGTERIYEVEQSPIHQGDHELGELVLFREVTAERKGERQREALIVELQAFAHTVAHDLKSPLAAVAMGVALLKPNSDPKALKTLLSCDRSLLKMVDIIDGLLLLATVRQTESVPIGQLNMARVVRDSELQVEMLPQMEHATIRTPLQWPVAFGHQPWVEAMWTNYLTNALKYGGSTPEITLGWTQATEGYVRFFVADRGPGLSPKRQDSLFMAFGEHESVGHGLGLSIVRRIAERLGGTVGMHDTAGGGCTFWFTLPIQDPSLPGKSL